MSGLLDVDTALARILEGVVPLPAEPIALADAHGRVLAQDIIATRNQPPFAASAMDGYAVRHAGLETLPSALNVIGEAAAGSAFQGTLSAGEAVRIFTGGIVPEGADTVVIQEDCDRNGSTVIVRETGPRGKFVRAEGLDFEAGATVVAAGGIFNAATVSLAAAANEARPICRRKPVVAILATGDELVPVGGEPEASQIIASNSVGIVGIAHAAGADVRDIGIAPDTMEGLAACLDRAADADIIVTLGGASVGDHDLVQRALVARGFDMAFWKIAMQPGKPVMFGRKGTQRVLGLPGNPVSGLVGAEVFLRPLIRALLGLPTEDRTQRGTLGRDLPASGVRRQYMRAKLEGSTATPFEVQDSSLLGIYAASDCLLVRPENAPAAKAGETCVFVLPSA